MGSTKADWFLCCLANLPVSGVISSLSQAETFKFIRLAGAAVAVQPILQTFLSAAFTPHAERSRDSRNMLFGGVVALPEPYIY